MGQGVGVGTLDVGFWASDLTASGLGTLTALYGASFVGGTLTLTKNGSTVASATRSRNTSANFGTIGAMRVTGSAVGERLDNALYAVSFHPSSEINFSYLYTALQNLGILP
jgi:hypothetical protein